MNVAIDGAVRPVSVTQETCRELLGVERRQFLAIVRALEIPSTRVGRTVFVLVDDWHEAMRAGQAARATPLDPVDDLATMIGFDASTTNRDPGANA